MCRPMLCYGDSNTYGYDPRSYLGGRYPKSVRWTGLLEAAGWTVINEGENGRTIPRAGWEIETAVQAVRRTQAERLVVMLGSNDLLQHPGPSAEVCGDRMELFLTAFLQEVLSPYQILLISPPPMKLGAWTDVTRSLEESHRLAGSYETLARKLGLNFADAGEWGVELTFDGVHFSEAGHRAFAEGIQKPYWKKL